MTPIFKHTIVLIVIAGCSLTSRAGEYVVDGFELGQPINPGDANYGSYDCQSSAHYDGAILCERQEQKKGQAGKLLVSSKLVHAAGSGPTWLESVHAAPVKLSRRALEKELVDLARVIGEEPRTVDWEPGYAPKLTAVVATWGDVELEEVYASPALQGTDRPGAYFDLIGDPAASLAKFLPVYRVKGGAGYIYAANFDSSGIGDRYYVAVNARELAPSSYRASLRALLEKDQTLDPTDYSLWPEVAMATRTLSLATSSSVANQQFDAVVDRYPSSKLRSHVWASLPSGAIDRLKQGSYWIDYDVYGPDTRYPAIRQELQDLIANEPNDNFVEFAHLLLGDFQGGLESKPDSIITGVFHYALGIESMRSLLKDALVSLQDNPPQEMTEEDLTDLGYITADNPDWGFSLNSAFAFVTRSPGVPPGVLSSALPSFKARAREVKAHLAMITDDMTVADDAAFMAALLDYHTGDLDGALAHASQGLGIAHAHADFDGTGRNDDWLDYESAARAQARRVADHLPREEVIPKLQADKHLSKEGFLWYGIAREAYRNFDYERAIELAEAGLSSLGLPSDQLPATTDPNKIRDAIERIAPDLLSDLNIVELPYLLEASREILSYENALVAEATATDIAGFSARARLLISKYSMLISSPEDAQRSSDGPPRHQDLRQALHLIDTTLQQTAHNPAYASLREWLNFRKVRILTVHNSDLVRGAVAQLADEFPTSQYLDDALAEQVFVEGMLNSDMQAASQALDDLLERAPDGSNAIDNAYSWMQISLKCHGYDQEAAEINSEIIRLFPGSRHAQYAVGRAADPGRYLRGCEGGYLD